MDAEERTLAQRYEAVLERLDRAVTQALRNRDEVRLIAVSKLHPAAMVAEVAALGQVDFGENYVQEALEKREKLATLGVQSLSWHMIGHVQSRKAPLVAGHFALIHTLDSAKLATAIEKRLCEQDQIQKVLIEVNVGEESQKSGIDAEKLHELCDHVAQNCPHLDLQGLMCIPPVFDAGEAARPYFARLRTLAEELRTYTGRPLPELSMGMSGDFEWAVLEGATFVRVGTDIFGPRPPKKV